jgi:hypothetical protein
MDIILRGVPYMIEKYGFVYIWFDRKHKRYYIGSHWGHENDGYICSSRWMRKAYKRRPEDFKRKTISKVFTNRKELLLEEHRWLSMIKDNELKNRYYNMTKHLNGHWSAEDNVKSISEKISIKTKQAMNTPEIREKYLEGLAKRDTKSSDPVVREKRSKSMKGKNVGKITVKFATGKGKAFHVTKDDPRLLSGEVIHVTQGLKRGPHSEERKDHLRKTSHFHEINSIKKKCDHCEFIGLAPHLSRYHNDKCKKKPITLTCVG